MIPESFAATYPSVTYALRRMHADDGENTASATPREGELARELATVNASVDSLDEVADALLETTPEPEAELARLSGSAYRHLGVSDDVRVFMGRLWAAASRSWTSSQRAEFLLSTVKDRFEVFGALDFTAELFKRAKFAADDLLPWLKAARAQVANDLMQGGLWTSVEAMCEMSPTEAVQLAMRWLSENPDAQSLSTVAAILGYVRDQQPGSQDAQMQLSALEERLRAGGPAWRSAYIQSWARSAGRGLLSHERATELFNEFVTANSDEETAWCYLLHVLAQRDSFNGDEWLWLFDQFRQIVRADLPQGSQYWLVLSVLKGLSGSLAAGSVVPVTDWLELLRSLCPILAASRQTWSRVLGALVDFTKRAPSVMSDIVVVLARGSGREWLESDDRSEFRWFLGELVTQNQHTALVSRLCFQPGTSCRRLGMQMFAECKVAAPDPSVVAAASSASVELLLLEARRVHVDYAALARLHAALAARVDELDGDLPELLYDEVSRQCRNTYAYRKALRALAPLNEYLMAIADDSETRIKETHDSFVSPALQMDVPGYARARRLHDRYMAGQFAKGVAEGSVLLNLFRKIHLLYGGQQHWRFFHPDGRLSAPSPFQSSSAEVEMPQLELANPEEAQMRRLQASVRIARLEQQIGSPLQ